MNPSRNTDFAGVASPSNSADLYLRWSLAPEVAEGRIEVLSPSVFRAGRTLIVVRHLSGQRRLPDHDRLILVVDDDWHGGLRDRTLPLAYRLKLGVTECRDARRLERAASVFMVASDVLADFYANRFPKARVIRIDPAWPAPPSQRTPDKPAAGGTRADIAYIGSPSHAGDMGHVRKVIDLCLQRRPDLKIIVAGGHAAPARWRKSGAVRCVPDMTWPDYWAWLQQARFGVVLYPLGPGPFNAARSISKLYEADRAGASLIASRRWTIAAQAAAEGRCQLVGDDPVAWRDAVEDALFVERGLATLAAANRSAILADDAMGNQRAVWHDVLWPQEGRVAWS